MPSPPRHQSSDPFANNNNDHNGPCSPPLPPPKQDVLTAVRDSVTIKTVTDLARIKMNRSHTLYILFSKPHLHSHLPSETPQGLLPCPIPTGPTLQTQSPCLSTSLANPHTQRTLKWLACMPILSTDLTFQVLVLQVSLPLSKHCIWAHLSVLHHDGPFDACVPSWNKHKHKAAMITWGQANIIASPLPMFQIPPQTVTSHSLPNPPLLP